jgi:hypothetical protein
MALMRLPAVRGIWPCLNRKHSSVASGCFPTVAHSGRISGSGSRALWSHSPCLPRLPFQQLSHWTLIGPGRACSHAPVSGAERPDTSPANAPFPLTFGIRMFSTRLFVNSEMTSSTSCSPGSPPPPHFRPSQWMEMRWNRRVFPAQPSEWCTLGCIPKSLHPPVFG